MNVLLTGRTGYLGREVATVLHEYNHTIFSLVRSHRAMDVVFPGEVIIAVDDIFDGSLIDWRSLLDGIDMVIHCAWHADPHDYLYSELNRKNLTGSLVLLENILASKVKRFVGIGSCIEYASSDKRISVSDELSPNSLYAACKINLFNSCMKTFAANSEKSFLWCRLFFLKGGLQPDGKFWGSMDRSLKMGKSFQIMNPGLVRDFIDVHDAAVQIVQASFSDIVGPVNICSGKGISLYELGIEVADKYEARDLIHANFDSAAKGNQTNSIVGQPYCEDNGVLRQ